MGIIVNLDVMLAKRKIKLQDLADRALVLGYKTYRSSKQAKQKPYDFQPWKAFANAWIVSQGMV